MRSANEIINAAVLYWPVIDQAKAVQIHAIYKFVYFKMCNFIFK